MEAIAIPGAAPAFVVGPLPVECQLVRGRVHAESLHVVLRIAAASQEDEGVATVKERCSEVVLRRAMTVAVAPVISIAARQGVGHPEWGRA